MSSSKPSADSTSVKPARSKSAKSPPASVAKPTPAPAAIAPAPVAKAVKSVAAAVAPPKPVAPPKLVAPVAAPKPAEPKAIADKPATPVVEPAKLAAPVQKAPADKLVKDTAETVKLAAAAPKALAEKAIIDRTATATLAVSSLQPSLKNVKPETAKVAKMTEIPTIKGYDEFTAISKANLDALVQANKVFAKGVEDISKEVLSLTQSSIESAATAAKAIFAAKTLKDVVELNTAFTRTHFDQLVANSTKLSEMSVKLATDAFAPITARVNGAVEKVKAAKPTA